MTPIIEDVTPEDYDDVLTVNEAAVPKVGRIDRDRLIKLHEESFYLRKALVEGKLAGLLLALDQSADYASPNFLWFKARYERFVYIDRVIVTEAFRRTGIGLKFYSDLESRARSVTSALMCEVNLEPPNPGSIAFHQSIGFREVGQQDTYDGTVRVSLMRKSLQMSGI
ncbi:MAG: GNAT family N-acetyltransferase [Gammaproteobacteria bacterium]